MRKLVLLIGIILLTSCSKEDACLCERVTYASKIEWQNGHTVRTVYEVSRYEVACQDESPAGYLDGENARIECE